MNLVREGGRKLQTLKATSKGEGARRLCGVERGIYGVKE